ncbi:carboxypeptidase-like regulatory domain-containing protein [Maribacter aquivivus]|uniref:carboxypeptidase-like regulatory domain-containing protein n=1 Tax=Maribacter aquivivus TaxID=228958 RepID=UPI0024939A62|nr:carboxypeptidase-like regulatory domain-containing protein [Maribacter aquivivus]
MRNITLILIFIFFHQWIYAQNIILRGIVTDSLNNPLIYSTLIAKSEDDRESMQFTSTNLAGRYKLELKKNVTYLISISNLGFKTYEYKHQAIESSERNFKLEEDVTQLDEVVVEIEIPIVVKKDTIIYRVDKFVTGEERKLKDVLEKLPGIEVDKDGVVTSQGREVTHVLVEDKSFFGGNSKLAVENIPANSVNQVEIIDDFNEIAFLKGMTTTENMALNIKLKEGKKNFVFGDVEAGKGNNSFYKAHSNLFYYKPKLNINFIGNANNTGEKTFTFKDYQNFVGGSSSVFNSRDIAERKIISDALETDDIVVSENKVGALNITNTFNDKIEVSSYFILSKSNNETLIETINDYILPGTSFIENLRNTSAMKKTLRLGKIKFKYSPSNIEQWSANVIAKGTDFEDRNAIISKINAEEQTFKSLDDSQETYIDGNIEFHKKISKKHAFSSSTNFSFNKNSTMNFWNTDRAISENFIPIEPANLFKLELLRKTDAKNISAVFKHYWSINEFNLLHTTFGNIYKSQIFFTKDAQILDDGSLNEFSSNGFGNDLNFRLNDLYFGMYHNTRAGEFEFHQSLFLHHYSWSINQSNTIDKNNWVLLPDISIRRRSASNGGFLRLDSSLKNSFSEASKFASNFYLNSYNSIYQGNENLKNELRHYSSLTYSKSSLLRGLFLMGILTYVYRLNGITNSIETENQDRLLSPIRLRSPNENLGGTVIIKKSTNKFKYSFTGKLNSSKFSQLLNSDISEYKNTIGSYQLAVQTLHKKFPVIELGFKQSLGNYGTSNNTFNFISKEPFLSFKYDFLNKFIFDFDYTYYDYKNKSTSLNNSFSLANAFISYNKNKSPWEFKLSAKNVFDVKFKNQNSFNLFVVSDQRTFILPRIAMFSITYKL